jgi:hypothetical protein
MDLSSEKTIIDAWLNRALRFLSSLPRKPLVMTFGI